MPPGFYIFTYQGKKMQNISIAKKLMILIIIPIIALITTSVTANIVLQNTQNRFEQVQLKVIPSILLLSETNSMSAAMRAAVRDYTIGGFINDPVLQAVQKEHLMSLKDKIKNNLKKYENEYLFNDEDRHLLNNDYAALENYLIEVEDVFQKVDRKDIVGISNQYSTTGTFRLTAMAMIRSFDEHATFKQKFADDLEKQGEEEYKNAVLMLYIQGLVTIIVLSIITYMMIQGIKFSLISMLIAITHIKSRLDATVHINGINKEDMSQMIATLNKIVYKLRESLNSAPRRYRPSKFKKKC